MCTVQFFLCRVSTLPVILPVVTGGATIWVLEIATWNLDSWNGDNCTSCAFKHEITQAKVKIKKFEQMNFIYKDFK